MGDMRTANFIRNVLEGLAELPGKQGIKVLQQCGHGCFQGNGIRANVNTQLAEGERPRTKSEVVEFMRTHVFPSFPCELKDGWIELTYNIPACICPLVKEHDVASAFMCNCTTGFAKSLFETVVGEHVEIQLIDSYLHNGKPCKMRIAY